MLTTESDASQRFAVPLQRFIDRELAVVLFHLVQLVEEDEVLFGILLRLLGDHQHELEVVRAQRHVVQVVYVDQEQQVLERFLRRRMTAS